jgi:NarL family two-component system response regulator LiaR
MNSGSSLRVMVVDDDADVRLLLDVQFRCLPGFELVGSTGEGQEVLGLVQALRPDAVVMDLLMPGFNGFDAISLLQEQCPSVGIVAYSGVAGSLVREEMGRRGVEVALKSGDVTPLADALRRCVASRSQPAGD